MNWLAAASLASRDNIFERREGGINSSKDIKPSCDLYKASIKWKTQSDQWLARYLQTNKNKPYKFWYRNTKLRVASLLKFVVYLSFVLLLKNLNIQ